MFHGFAMNSMAKGLVIEVTAESPKWLTSKEWQRLDDDGMVHG